MAVKLPDYTSLGGADVKVSGGPVPSYKPEGFVSDGIGKGLMAAAKAVEAFQADYEKLEDFETQRKFYETMSAADQQFQQDSQNADPTGRDFAKTAAQNYGSHFDSFLSNVPQRLRPQYEATIARQRMSYGHKATDFEFRQRESHYSVEVQNRANALAPGVLANPDSYDSAVADATGFLDSSGLSPTARHTLRGKIEDTLAASRIQGLRNSGRTQEADDFEIQLDERERQRQQSAPALGPAPAGAAPGYVAPRADVESHIVQSARARGIDPNIALRVYRSEGSSQWQSTVVKNGHRERSYGPFQLYIDGGLGNKFQRETGLDPRDPSTWRENIDFALDEAKQGGWGPWYGAKAAGITGRRGLDGEPVRTAQADTGTATDASSSSARGGAQADINDLNTDLPVGRWQAYGQRQQFEVDKAIKKQQTEAARADAEMEKAEAARMDRILIDASAGLGTLPPRVMIEENPGLKEEKRNELLRKYDAASKDAVLVQKSLVKFSDPNGGTYNPFDPDEKKAVDKIYGVLGGNLDALESIVRRTGMVPTPAVRDLRGALVSNDPQRVGAAMSVAVGLMDRNPNIFAGKEGANEIEDAAVAYRQYVDRFGWKAEQATAKIIEDQSAEYKASVKARIKGEDINELVRKKLKIDDLGEGFDTSWLPLSDPKVEFTGKARAAVFSDYAELFKLKYEETGNVDVAKKQAIAQLKKVWGVTRVAGGDGVVMHFSPEQARAYADIPNVSDRIAEQAMADIKESTGQDVDRKSLILAPRPGGQTSRAYMTGEPVPYTLSWFDKNGNLQVGQRAWIADPKPMRDAMSAERQRQFEVEHGTAEMFRKVREPTPARKEEMRIKAEQDEVSRQQRLGEVEALAGDRQRRREQFEKNRGLVLPDVAPSPREILPSGPEGVP